MLIYYPFSVRNDMPWLSDNRVTGLTFTLVFARTKAPSPANVATPDLPTVVEVGGGQYLAAYDPVAGGPAVWQLDTGAPAALTGTLLPASFTTAVTGTGTAFTTQCAVGRFIVFANDAQGFPYRVAAIANDTSLTIAPAYDSTSSASPLTTGAATVTKVALGRDRFLDFDSDASSVVTLAPAGLDAITVEAGVNARQALSPILAAAAGVIAGQEVNSPVIRAGNNPSVVRISATTDNNGNRTAVTLTVPG